MIDGILTQIGVPPNLQGQPWHLVFERPAPAWMWLAGSIVIIAASAYSYANLRGSRSWRTALAALRAAALALIALLAMQPAIEWPRERIEADYVEVLVDRSSSMQVRDAVDPQGKLVSRAEVEDAILSNAMWDRIGAEHKVEWIAVAGGATAVPAVKDLPAAEGNRTLLASAVHETLQRNLGRPLSAIVLISDGRSQDTVSTATLRQMQSLGVPIFTMPLGDPEGVNDRSVVSVEAPQTGFLRDQIPVQAQLATRKPNEKIRVVLREKDSNRKIDEQEAVSGPDGKVNVTLVGQGAKSGDAVWEVAIDGAPDADQSNDSQRVDIAFVDRAIRVLYLDGWPRWEFRYLKNVLLREKGIESSIMLLSADRDFAQEGTTPLSRLPRTEKEFDVFDVVILGDVPSGFLSTVQQKGIQELVAKRGAGLLWIAGERSTPSSWRGTPLEDLLPFRGSLDLPRVDRPVFMEPTEAAARIGLLRLGNTQDAEEAWPREISSNGEPWSRLEWVQRIDPRDLKPTAEVLATAVPQRDTNTKPGEPAAGTPLVLTMRFGAGQTTYVATDETWRWRHGRGETLPERFWVQLVRHLARSGLRNGAGVTLLVEPPRVATGQPVRITVDLAGVATDEVVTVEARREKNSGVIDIALKPESGDRYSAIWTPPSDGEGAWTFRIRQPQIADAPEARLVAIQEDAERIDATPDHDALEKLSAATKGQVVAVKDLESLEKLIPRRSFTTRQPIQVPLWNHWIFYAFLVVLLTAEWIGRRILQLT
ncbi:MAG: VWA domain-containing protein [Planctomycetes bacterium]|nr:VWA domain-containing protein [Planctomycetota bacterium]